MATTTLLSYYARQGGVTDPREHAGLFDDVPCDAPALCRLVQGLVVHVGWASAYGIELTDTSRRELSIRSVAEQLRVIRTADPRPLSVPRPVASRMLGTCRDFALLLCGMLRHRGIPARVRCGFASYLGPNRYEDHWICEHWIPEQNRWRIVDAQLDALQRGHLNVTFDTSDLPAGKFLPAGQAWQMCRAGEADPTDCGQQAATGLWFMHVNVVRDLLALAKTEISPWDGWRHISPAKRTLDDTAAALTDELARMPSDADRSGMPVRLPAGPTGELTPPWRD